ncbi:APC family permease [Clostridium botulinum]|uniref:Amino acid permease n=1 Tax=Clostridium botulinum TaxID=1491 RepID=A0A6G4EB49_CLOBO|nr:amino acid permease [Clostridium botulinum]APH17935.1 amino acid permease family protein [Clostridium botulinum]AUM90266.1 amino acid permease [Clostridium botulinum]KEI77581.1 amino acid permease [Clostridium botulinum A2 117]MBN3414735.1 amino acid permease [Clostridium botulinum]MBN3441028.1 amino acid permease [Clostridium botulinum]
MEGNNKLKKEIGLFTATFIVAGNIIGSGIFMLPATLAEVSGPGATMAAWIITGIGSIFLALSFARLGSKIPKTGGPYQYAKIAFGDFVGFTNAWLYWSATCISNAAIITAIASYSSSLVPVLKTNGLYAFLYTSAILWAFNILNIIGVKQASAFETVITIFKLGVFLVFVIIGFANFNPQYITPAFPKGKGFSTVPLAAATTLWAFSGFESASIAAGEIKSAEKNVKLSTIYGLLIAVLVYLVISFVAMGGLPQDMLAKSNSPMSDILALHLSSNAVNLFLLAIVITIFGTIAGWIMLTARISYAAAVDGMFPQAFAKIHPKYRTPHVGIIINGILTNIVLLMNYTGSMTSAYNFMILLATLAYLPVYAITNAADILLLSKREEKFNVGNFIINSIVPLIGFIYAIWAVYGTGAESALYGLLLGLMGIPFYIYMKMKDKKQMEKIRKQQ